MKSSKFENRQTFGSRLRFVRRLRGIPQDKLGVKIGLDEFVASARISRYESGKHAPPFEIAKKLASVLGVPTVYFYCEDDRMAQLILLVAPFTDEQWSHLLESLASSQPGNS